MKKKNILFTAIGSALAVAATIFFIRKKNNTETPPKNAPQLDIDNPGEQSEFTPAPSNAPDLG